MTERPGSDHDIGILTYLVGSAESIVERGADWESLNELSRLVMGRPAEARAVFWGLLIASIECRDGDRYRTWAADQKGEFSRQILTMIGWAELWLSPPPGFPERTYYERDIDGAIDSAVRTPDSYSTLSELVVAVVRMTHPGLLQSWIAPYPADPERQ